MPGIEVQLVDEDGADALAGDPGELWVRGPNVFPGYWHDDEATARVLTPDGWLRTGDVAVVEETGDLRLVDRAKDLIIVSGFNVFPVEVEDVLLADPTVHDVAVIGEPSPRTGEAVVAFVVAEPGTTPDAALAPGALRAIPWRATSARRAIDVVAELPRSVAGKLLRRELRSLDASLERGFVARLILGRGPPALGDEEPQRRSTRDADGEAQREGLVVADEALDQPPAREDQHADRDEQVRRREPCVRGDRSRA